MQKAHETPEMIQIAGELHNHKVLDQLWTRNLAITNAIVADPIDQVSDHCPIQVKMEALFI